MIGARSFGRQTRPDLEDALVDRLLRDFRDANPGVMFKNDVGHWHFNEEHREPVTRFLNDEAAVETARKNQSHMAMFSSGRSRGRSEAQVRLKTVEGYMYVSADKAATIMQEMTDEVQRLENALRQRASEPGAERTYTVQDIAGATHTFTAAEMHRSLPSSTLNNRSLVKERDSLKEQLAAALSEIEANKPVTKPEPVAEPEFVAPHTRNYNTAVEEVAQLVARNPALFVSAANSNQALLRIADAVKRAGLRTVTGKPWNYKNLCNYKEKIRARVEEILREQKPRVRVRQQKIAA
jgi:hypothetical protein